MDKARRVALILDAVLVTGSVFVTVLAVRGSWSALPWPVVAVAGLAGSVALWARRRWPRTVALVGAASCVLSGNPIPLLVGLYSAAVSTSARLAWVFAVAGWAGLTGWSWLDAGQPSADEFAGWALVAGLVTAFGVYMATRTRLVASLREQAAQAEAERVLREERARAGERMRIAREMHDVLAHKVSLIALHAGALELQATGRAAEGAALIRVTAREALQELRTVLGVLQAEPAPWFPNLAALVEASTAAGQRVSLRDEAGELPPHTARVVYRIVQEGLTNAHRYAPDAPTTVSVSRDDSTLTVTVANERGAGAPSDLPGSGTGLVGLAERVRLVGGSLHSGPDGNGGWQLRAEVVL